MNTGYTVQCGFVTAFQNISTVHVVEKWYVHVHTYSYMLASCHLSFFSNPFSIQRTFHLHVHVLVSLGKYRHLLVSSLTTKKHLIFWYARHILWKKLLTLVTADLCTVFQLSLLLIWYVCTLIYMYVILMWMMPVKLLHFNTVHLHTSIYFWITEERSLWYSSDSLASARVHWTYGSSTHSSFSDRHWCTTKT